MAGRAKAHMEVCFPTIVKAKALTVTKDPLSLLRLSIAQTGRVQ